jgi:sugar phosphate isomerase/epimerase
VNSLSEPLPDIVRKAGEAGFEGVEFAHRFHEEDPAATAAALEESDVTPIAVHAELPIVEAAVEGENDLIDRCETIGCDRVIIPHISPRHFRSRVLVRSLSNKLSDIASELEARGIELGYHTIRYDLRPMLPEGVETLFNLTPLPEGVADHATQWLARYRRDSRETIPSDTGLWNLFARTAPDELFFELEVAEVRAAGYDPAAVFPLFDGRVRLMHLRDVAPTGRFGDYENVEHGKGTVDFDAVLEAARSAGVEWAIYENELAADSARMFADGIDFLDRVLDDETQRRRKQTVTPGT